jgi:hypothetical protein
MVLIQNSLQHTSMRSKLIKVSEETAKTLRRWEPNLLRPYSTERQAGPKYFTAVEDKDGWDVITYYID